MKWDANTIATPTRKNEPTWAKRKIWWKFIYKLSNISVGSVFKEFLRIFTMKFNHLKFSQLWIKQAQPVNGCCVLAAINFAVLLTIHAFSGYASVTFGHTVLSSVNHYFQFQIFCRSFGLVEQTFDVLAFVSCSFAQLLIVAVNTGVCVWLFQWHPIMPFNRLLKSNCICLVIVFIYHLYSRQFARQGGMASWTINRDSV